MSGVLGKHARVLGDDGSHDYRHGPGRTGNLSRRAAEYRGKEANQKGAVQSCNGAGAGRYAHGQGQGHDRGGQSTIDIATQVLEVEAVD